MASKRRALARAIWRMRVHFPEPIGRAWERRIARLTPTIALPLSGIVQSLSYARPLQAVGLPAIA